MPASHPHPIFVAQPWFGQPLALPHEPVGMLGRHEAALFHHLARDWFRGRGAIVDAGSFLGKSAWCFGTGLRANPNVDAAAHRVHCFDNFTVFDHITIDFLRRELGLTVGLRQSFRSVFERQVAPVRDLLEVHEGDFHQANWDGQPIELLMVDIGKTVSLWRHVVRTFFDHLLPGESLVVHQDYHHPWLPFLHVSMEFLADWFELVAPRVDDSAVFAYTRRIPAEVLARVQRYDFSPQEQMQLMDRAIARLPADARYHVELARAVLRLEHVDPNTVVADLAAMRQRYAERFAERSWANYFAKVQKHAAQCAGWWRHRHGDYAGALAVADELLADGEPDPYLLAMRGSCLLALGRPEAEAALRAAVAVRPYDGYAAVNLARVLAGRGALAEAEQVLLQAMADPDAKGAPPSRYADALLQTWQAAPQPDHVREQVDRLLATLPREPEAWGLDARVRLLLGDRAGGLASLRRASGLGLPPDRLAQFHRDFAITAQEAAPAP